MSGLPLINLLPNAIKLRRGQRRAVRRWAQINFVVLLAAASAFAVTESSERAQSATSARTLEEVAVQIEQLRAQVADIDARARDASRRVAASDALANHPDWGVLIELLGRLSRDHVTLRAIELTPKAPPGSAEGTPRAAGATTAGAQARLVTEEHYQLTITADGVDNVSVSNFLIKLIDSGVFSAVEMASSARVSTADAPVYRCTIVCSLAPVMPARPVAEYTPGSTPSSATDAADTSDSAEPTESTQGGA